MAEKVTYYAEDIPEMLHMIEEAMKKHYEKTLKVQDWLNMNCIQIEVWKN